MPVMFIITVPIKNGDCRQSAFVREEDFENQLRQAILKVALPG